MGIKLDWNIDADDEQRRVEEDPLVVAARKQSARQLRNLVIFVAIVSLLAGAVALSRLRRAEGQRRAELEAAVAAEALSLRIGDETAFLECQEHEPRWRAFQRGTFEEYQTLGSRLVVSGEILDLTIDANLARVVLRETLDGEPYRVTWFYEYFPDEGWRRIPSSGAFLGWIRHLETDHFEVFYREADEDYTQAVIAQTETWVGEICGLTPCVGIPQMTVFIVTEPLHEVTWQVGGTPALLVPSPATMRLRERAPLEDPALRSGLAETLTWQWATAILGGAITNQTDAEWMRDELAAWLAVGIDDTQPGSDAMDALVDTYGAELVMEWVSRVRTGERVLPTLALLSGNVLTTLPVPWEGFFEHRLQVEFETGDPASVFQTLPGDFPPEPLAPLTESPDVDLDWNRIRVEAMRRENNVFWIQATTYQTGLRRSPLTLLIRFSEVEGDWILTAPELTDWQDPQQLCGEHVCVHYFSLDAPFAAEIVPALETAYAQTLDDLAPALPERQFAILVVPSEEAAANLAAPPDSLQAVVLSPHAAGIVIGPDGQSYIQNAATAGMIRAWISAAVEPLPDETPMVQAFINWERARLQGGSDRPDACCPTLAQRSNPTATLALHDYHEESATMDQIAAWALLDVIEAQYGAEAMGPLLAALPQTTDMDVWLRTVGGSMDEIAPLWEAALIEALGSGQ